jgi:DNA polymerase III alpha subunit
MQLTKFNETIVTEDDLVQAVYSGKNINLDEIILDSFEDCVKFNDAVKKNYDNLPELKTYQESKLTVKEFDNHNQNSWFMPNEYKTFDIENWVLGQAPDIIAWTRVEKELDLFRQHNMIPLLKYLKYLVDTMRKNNIVWGVGRGSSVASYCLYLIGVHKIDSIKYNLDIKEFLK